MVLFMFQNDHSVCYGRRPSMHAGRPLRGLLQHSRKESLMTWSRVAALEMERIGHIRDIFYWYNTQDLLTD